MYGAEGSRTWHPRTCHPGHELMTNAVLELRDLGRAFPGFQLGPLSLRLHPGQVYGLLGPNGAGKTTLLDLIASQLQATSGTLSHGGRRIRWGDRGWKARFSYIREMPSFYAELTVAQILELAGQLYPHWDPALADSLVGTFHLRPHQRVGHLSKGTRVKLGIVTALSHRAELLILDEPTAGLDPSARADRSGPRNLDSGLSEISIVFQAAVPKPVAPKYTTSGVRRPSEL